MRVAAAMRAAAAPSAAAAAARSESALAPAARRATEGGLLELQRVAGERPAATHARWRAVWRAGELWQTALRAAEWSR